MEIELRRVCRKCGTKMGNKIPETTGELKDRCDNCGENTLTLPSHYYGLNGHLIKVNEQ